LVLLPPAEPVGDPVPVGIVRVAARAENDATRSKYTGKSGLFQVAGLVAVAPPVGLEFS
jgi:hypothetical protein